MKVGNPADKPAPVTVAGLKVEQGDLLHGDVHGVVRIPVALAPELPDAIRAHEAVERRVLDVCRSPGFDPEALDAAWGQPKQSDGRIDGPPAAR